MIILYLSSFARMYKKLPIEIKRKAEAKEKIFRKNPFERSLETHKLGGRLRGKWAFSIDHKNRIVFDFSGDDVVKFYYVGDHSIYE